MESSIECISSTDVMDEDEISHPHPYSQILSSKQSHNNINYNNLSGVVINPATSVHELLECPVCTNSMYPPIHQCHNGHTLCSTCKARVHNRCPTCRQELGDIRCLALEKVAESLELPCKYCSLGCTEIFPYYSKLKHEALCNFRPYNCPYAGSECSVVGDIQFLVTHLRDDHKVDMHSGCTFNHRYVKSNPRDVENATWMLTVFHCFGQYFCLHFEAFQLGMAPVYMAFLRFMGDEMDARNYCYSLEVGGNGRKLIWEGTPRSVRDSHRKVRDSHDGLIIQRNMALFFSGGDRKELKLRVTGRIWKEQQNPDGGPCIPNLCTITISPHLSPQIPFLSSKLSICTLRFNKKNPSTPNTKILPLHPSFSLYLPNPLRSKKSQISAHFNRPTNRKNYLRKKLNRQQQQVSDLRNPVLELDRVNNYDSNEESKNFDTSSEFHGSSEERKNFDTNYGIKESETGLSKNKLGESIMLNKLETWVEQYKKDSEFWGVGTSPIFTVFHDSEGMVDKVVVNEEEILNRSRVSESEDLAKVNLQISFAKGLAKEMENGSNVIPKNSSVAKFLLSGEKSGFMDSIRGVTLKPASLSRMSRVGVLVLCGLFVVSTVKSLFAVKEDKEEYTSLEKEMLRRKIKARAEKEKMEKGSVEVLQDPVEPRSLSFSRPQLDNEQLLNSINQAKGSSNELEAVQHSSYQNKEFKDKIEDIRTMARHAREIEKQDSLMGGSDEEDDESLKEFTGESLSLENDILIRNEMDLIESTPFTTPQNDFGKSNADDLVEKNQSSPNISGSSRPEVKPVQNSMVVNLHSDGPDEVSSKTKFRIIKSVKEAREYLSRKDKKPEVNQELEVRNDGQTIESAALSGRLDFLGPSENYNMDCETAEGNVDCLNGIKIPKITLDSEVSVSNQDTTTPMFEIPEEVRADNETSKKHNVEDSEENETLVDLQMPKTNASNEVSGRTEELAPSINKGNWLEKNFHEFEPLVKKIRVGYRDNYKIAKEKANQESVSKTAIMELKFDDDESELEWMKDENLRNIVFKVRDNELSGRDPFHLMSEEDKCAFFGGLEKKVEQTNEKLLHLHEYLHSNIENLDYGADGISLYDPPEKIIPRWKNPPAERSPEFLNNFVEQRKTLVSESLKDSFASKKIGKEEGVHKPEETSLAAANVSDQRRKLQKEPSVSSKTIVQGSDGSIRAGKKNGKEFWEHTKKWSQGFLDSYNAETDPEIKSTMRDMGKDLDRWITEKEIKEAAELMDKLPEKGQKFIKDKLNKVKREMELFGPQAVVGKYREYAEEKEEDYLWWLDLPCVLCIELYTVENGEERVGFYSLEMAPDLELDPKQHHVIAFEDAGDCKNLCYIIQAQMELLGNGNAFVVARPPKDAFREAKANNFSVTVIRKSELQLNIDQTLEQVEELIVEIGSKIYHDKIMKERSVDINGLMKGVFGATKPTKKRMRRSKRKLKQQ
ncbi:hypothetical protein ACJIZ3_016404 [Penstemon smallii]|uniref:RING-type E3 ubiquitin transferase n=1 Tax=Penstemon smallii TaxID=265156 RepID=A0ABD3RT11_9LAMI